MKDQQLIKKSNRIWFVSFVFINVLTVLLAVIINPYRLLPFSLTIPFINDVKPQLYDYQRYIKLFDISREKPKTLLLGSSRVLWGLDPQNASLQQKGYLPVYNAGILGPPMYEIKKYFDHALLVSPHLKRVILGIDFYAFNNKFDHREFILAYSFGKKTNRLLEIHHTLLGDVKAIFATLKSSLLREKVKSLREDGRLTPSPIEAPEVYAEFVQEVQNTHNRTNSTQQNIIKEKKSPKMRNELYEPFSISSIDMDALKYIVEQCRERHIELYIFLTPTYRSLELSALHELHIWNQYIQFLKMLADIHPFWSFYGKNEINDNIHNYMDGSHFIFPVGDKILDSMLLDNQHDNMSQTFGEIVTRDNINQFLQHLNNLIA